MLTTPELCRFYLAGIEREANVRLNMAITDEHLTALIWQQSEKFDSMAMTTYTRRERRFRFDGSDQFEQTLPAYPVKRLYWLRVFIGSAGLIWEFREDKREIIYIDHDVMNRIPELTTASELYVDRLTGRMVVPVFWMFMSPQTTTFFPYHTFGGIVAYLGYARRFVGGAFTLEAHGLFGFDVEDDEPLLRPPLDVQEAVAKLVAIEVAKVVGTWGGGLSSWSLGERSENYAGGAPFAWIIEKWERDVQEIVQRHYNMTGITVGIMGSGAVD